MGRRGHDGGRQRGDPFLQRVLPGLFSQLPVEEGYPIPQPAPVPKKLPPVRSGDWVGSLGRVYQARLLLLDPREDRLGPGLM